METTWDLGKIYKNNEEFSNDINKLKGMISRVNEIRNDFKGNFKEILELTSEASELVSQISTFASMTRDEDSTVSESQKLVLEAEAVFSEFNSAFSFLNPSVLELSQEELDELIEKNDLESYRKFLEDTYRFKSHTLSKKEEFILGSLSTMAQAPQSAYYMLTNADMKFPKLKSKDDAELTNANFVNYLRDSDVEVRKEAFNSYYDVYAGVENTVSTLMQDNVKNLVTEAKLRSYDSAIQMELFKDDVDVKVYENLIKSVRENLEGLHEYYRIKKEALNLDEQHMYDVYLPIAGDMTDEIPYEKAVETIKEALKPLGEDYSKVLARAFDERWIDVYPRKGKKSGAYSWGVYSSDPYILMNYTDDLDSMFTLAHELGHSMHSYYSRKNNPYIYSDYTIFVAEVASTTNELLLLNYLLDKAKSDEEKLYLVDHYLNSFKSTVFRQTMFAEFEKMTHETVEKGEALTLDLMNDIYLKLNEDYFGDSVIIDDKIKYEWSRIPHFYRNFYVYKYSTGFLSAAILSKKILDGENLADYLNFLADGGRNFPIDQLKKAGADILNPDTFNTAFSVFNGLVEELKNLL